MVLSMFLFICRDVDTSLVLFGGYFDALEIEIILLLYGFLGEEMSWMDVLPTN